MRLMLNLYEKLYHGIHKNACISSKAYTGISMHIHIHIHLHIYIHIIIPMHISLIHLKLHPHKGASLFYLFV